MTMNDVYSAWKINEKDFPETGTPEDKLSFLAKYAVLAPSTYNTQPWLFEVSQGEMVLSLDRRYGLPVIDPQDRQMIISCSAAILNLEIAAEHFGYSLDIEIFDDAEETDKLAVIKLKDRITHRSDENSALFRAIPERQMNRYHFHSAPLAQDDMVALKKAVSVEGAWIHVCDENEKESLIKMIVDADYAQNSDKNFRREIASWLDKRRVYSGDGMPELQMKCHDLVTTSTPLAVRRFFGDDGDTVPADKMSEGSPVLAIIGSVTGSLENKIKAGKAFMRLLLAAQSRGIGVSTLNQPCQIAETRLRLYDELGLQGRAQIIVRMGYPKKKPLPAPRRPFDKVIIGSGYGTTKAPVKQENIFSKIIQFFRRLFLAK
mgnify:CR=1 FL=1